MLVSFVYKLTSKKVFSIIRGGFENYYSKEGRKNVL